MSSMRAPADNDTVRAAALLVVEAVASWAEDPHQLGITFTAAPDGPFPYGDASGNHALGRAGPGSDPS